MATNDEAKILKNGTWVKVHGTGFAKCKIVEYRGPLGPGGARIYRVQYRGKPYPGYAEFREDQLEVIPPEA